MHGHPGRGADDTHSCREMSTNVSIAAWVQCHACGHDCRIPPGAVGVCKVRFNETASCGCRGAMSPACNAIRLKRSRFFTPGRAHSRTASGCSAAICTARTARTGSRRRRCATRWPSPLRATSTPSDLAADAVRQGARVVVSTYNEPLITVEWAVEVFKAARAQRPGDRICLQR